jgi:solute carrier family 25 aspartate/glutamate transporter 12/13
VDTIKTRVQYVRPDGFKYNGIAHAAVDTYRKEGFGAFMRTAPQRCMIIAPLFGITMLVYEVQQHFFSKMK